MRFNVLGSAVSSLAVGIGAIVSVCHGQLIPAAGPATSEYRMEQGTAAGIRRLGRPRRQTLFRGGSLPMFP
jgi:hypothetical protein